MKHYYHKLFDELNGWINRNYRAEGGCSGKVIIAQIHLKTCTYLVYQKVLHSIANSLRILQNDIHVFANLDYHPADSKINIIGAAVWMNVTIMRRKKIFPLLFPRIFKFFNRLLTKMQEIKSQNFAACSYQVRCLTRYLLY